MTPSPLQGSAERSSYNAASSQGNSLSSYAACAPPSPLPSTPQPKQPTQLDEQVQWRRTEVTATQLPLSCQDCCLWVASPGFSRSEAGSSKRLSLPLPCSLSHHSPHPPLLLPPTHQVVSQILAAMRERKLCVRACSTVYYRPPSLIFFLITCHLPLSLTSPSLSYVQMHFMHFINTARYIAQLTPVTPHLTSPHRAVAYNHDQVSEDQMRSAFEIADTNGDGVLTYTEAVEVKPLTLPSLHCFSACMHTCYKACQEDSILFSLPW